jgi:hypothetical protein
MAKMMVMPGPDSSRPNAVFGVLAAGLPVAACTDPSGDWLAAADADCDAEALADADALADCDAEALADADAEALADADAEALGLPLASVQFSEFVFEFETTVESASVAITPRTPPVASWNGVLTSTSTSSVPLPLNPPISMTP